MINKVVTKKLGRPARTSREDMLNAALALLREGEAVLSMRNLAARLGTAPTSIYNYFASKEDLLNQLAEVALDDLWLDCRDEGPWQQQLSQWMHHFHKALLQSPELMTLISLACVSQSFLSNVKQLFDLLSRAGFTDAQCARQAQSLVWEVMGFTSFQITSAQPQLQKRFKQNAKQSSYPEMTRYLAMTSANYDELWEATVARTMAGLEAMAQQENAR
jgi:AcrR family transcriptional regulator